MLKETQDTKQQIIKSFRNCSDTVENATTRFQTLFGNALA